ncbi:MAG: laccase domain-containing protein, partial [Candidatus Dadabacteria bacterium]
MKEFKEQKRIDLSYIKWCGWQKTALHFIGKPLNFKEIYSAQFQKKFLPLFKIKKLFILKQVHSNRIIELDLNKSFSSKVIRIGEGDGIYISDLTLVESGFGIGIFTADCLPIFIKKENKLIALHCGWRGLASGIIENALDILSPSLENIEVVIGPAICWKCYPVGREVYESVTGLS